MVRSNSIQPDPTKKKQPWQGALSKKKVGGSEGSPLQEVDYTYNIRGWLTSVNQPQNLGKDLFGFELKYQNPVSNGKDTPKYNGNISQMDWKTRSNNEELRRYTYQYDDLNRLTKSFYSKPLAVQPNTGSYDEYLSYDVNDNIKTLSRFGDMDKPQAVKIDELSYTYIGNQLVKVSDNSQNPSGYPIGGGVIPYDENGNMMNHKDKGISYIGYNHLNLPSAVFWNRKQTFYLYRADGVKVKKDFPGKVTDYLDGFQYENGALQFVPTAEGYYDFVKQRYVYNYTDHLGNVRLSYTKNNNGALEILEENNYYAFGLKHKGYGGVNLGNPNYHYKYNGKELQENSMYDYGARLYIPEIGRWNAVDPLAEKTMTPYAYTNNNPIMLVDPDGRSGEPIIDVKNNTVTVHQHLIFYGNKANSELSGKIATGIASQWNGARGKVKIDGVEYKVRFKVTYETVSIDKAKKMAKNNEDIRNNFIRVEKGSGSSKFHLGGNSGWFNTNDELEGSTTPAHEIGHGLGLDHTTSGGQTKNDVPDIMEARGTEVHPRWSKKGPSNEIDPNFRRVDKKEVEAIFKGVKFDEKGKGKIGKTTNKIFTENGK